MKAVVTASIDDCRFFVSQDGTVTDIPDRAMEYRDLHEATIAANRENAEWRSMGFNSTWQPARLLFGGSVAVFDGPDPSEAGE